MKREQGMRGEEERKALLKATLCRVNGQTLRSRWGNMMNCMIKYIPAPK